MQNVSSAYKKSMKAPLRNRGYIRVIIGVVNQKAQSEASAADQRNSFTYFSEIRGPFESEPVNNVYATCEQDFSLADGAYYFLPEKKTDVIYNNGIATEHLSGSVYIVFQTHGLDIKGMTIDFGRCYPVDFLVENDQGIHSYMGNDRQYWTTEDVFRGTSFIKITPVRMINGQGRLRIFRFMCGIVNTFTNKEVINFSFKDFLSPVTESLPSQDMTLTVDNQNLYYSVDNPDSALAFMEIGQEVRISFGYDLDGMGNVEWLPAVTSYLKTWTANDKQARFTATDKFDFFDGIYYRGQFRPAGISLYDLAIDVLQDAGIDEDGYIVDPYLKHVVVYNPMPAVKHTEALQIIANAGRCVMYQDRAPSRIHIQSSFIPDMYVSANNQTDHSHAENLLQDDKKDAYALQSNDFALADGSLFFMPSGGGDLNTGYISAAVADGEGRFANNPKIMIDLEAAFVMFGLLIRFRNVAPPEFNVVTYYQGLVVDEIVIQNPELTWITHVEFHLFDKLVIEFTRGHPNSRVTVDNVLIGDVTDYSLTYNYDLMVTPAGTRQGKIQAMQIQRSIYRESAEEPKELLSEEILISPDRPEYTVYFNNPSYGLAASVVENDSITCDIVECSNYYAVLRFSGVAEEIAVKFNVTGREYIVDKNWLKVPHGTTGETKEWKNPLVSTVEHARELEEWLASYYLGDVSYKIDWRGDPATDSNDLFYLELKDRDRTMIRSHKTSLTFNGAWKGQMEARRVKLYGDKS